MPPIHDEPPSLLLAASAPPADTLVEMPLERSSAPSSPRSLAGPPSFTGSGSPCSPDPSMVKKKKAKTHHLESPDTVRHQRPKRSWPKMAKGSRDRKHWSKHTRSRTMTFCLYLTDASAINVGATGWNSSSIPGCFNYSSNSSSSSSSSYDSDLPDDGTSPTPTEASDTG